MFQTIADFLANTPVYSPAMIAILIGTGLVVGFINTIAGLATSISYILFMAMGMPINIANGTTRLGVLAQFATSSFVFKKEGMLDIKRATAVGIPVTIGALFGAELAAIAKSDIMEIILGCMLPLLVVLLYIDSKKIAEKRAKARESGKVSPWKFIIFMIIGMYGGFTHAGVGILILFGCFFMLGMDLVHANALKQFAVLLYTPIALTIFIIHGQVNWPVAIIYAIGNVGGGYLASKVAIKYGSGFIKISVTVIVLIISFWLIYKQF